MLIQKLMEKNELSVYELAKRSGVPYTTVSNICKGKTKIENCSAKTLYKIARALGISVDELIAPAFVKRPDFENFKSSICQRVKVLGDLNFIVDTLEHGLVKGYFNIGWEAESFYLIGMIDYLCRENNLPRIEAFDDLRQYKLTNTVLPLGVITEYRVTGDKNIIREAVENAIPEFMAFNIVENEIRDVA